MRYGNYALLLCLLLASRPTTAQKAVPVPGGGSYAADVPAANLTDGWAGASVGATLALYNPQVTAQVVTVYNKVANGTLIASRTSVGPSETFQWFDPGNGVFALKAANGKFVTAPNSTTSLTASGTDLFSSAAQFLFAAF